MHHRWKSRQTVRTTRTLPRCAKLQFDKQKLKLKLVRDMKNYKKGFFSKKTTSRSRRKMLAYC